MAFLRNSNREKYTVIDNQAVRDDNLSLKALGLLVKLLSFPDNWEFSENGLEKVFTKDGQTSIRTGIKELENLGYLKRTKLRDEKGRIIKVEWKITENPHFENHSLDIPNLDIQPQYNTNKLNTNKSNTNNISTTGKKTSETCPYQEILDLYHSICVSYPKLRGLSESRKKHINARWAENLNIETFKELFEKAESSSFLKGNSNNGWKANFDWLMNPNNFSKVLEGNYVDKQNGSKIPTNEDYEGGIF